MSEDNKYNGWTNRETWLVKLWIDNEQESYFHWRDRSHQTLLKSSTRDNAVHTLAGELKSWCDEIEPELKHGMFADLLTAAISRVEWSEISQSMVQDREEESIDPLMTISYTRAQAIADGVLVNVSELAKEAGFKFPVAMTSVVWAYCVTVPLGVDDQDEVGRLWDVLNVLRFSIRGSDENRSSSEVRFTVSVRTDEVTSEDTPLKALCGPGDDGEPVITIMLPGED